MTGDSGVPELNPPEARPLLGSEVSRVDSGHQSPIPPETPNDDIRHVRQLYYYGGEYLRIAGCMYSFLVLGLFMSTIGPIIPHLEGYYDLTDLQVSSVFISGLVGYVLAAQLNGHLHRTFGQRAIAVVGPLFQLGFAAIAATHPPFPIFVVAYAFGFFGHGIIDGSWCAWAAGMDRANLVSGLLHASFSLGAGLGPFLTATLLAADEERPWYFWYYVMTGVAFTELVLLTYAFRGENAKSYHETHRHSATQDVSVGPKSIYTEIVTWICAAYLLVYVGAETTISEWLVVFMIRVRGVTPYWASVCSSGFWSGMAAGRLVLGYLADRFGVRYATTAYILCAIVLEILFIFASDSILPIILITLVGFCFGPLFPSGVIQMNRRLPRDLHVAATSFVAAIGQVGGALLPFGLGAAAQAHGIEIFQAVIPSVSVIVLLFWAFLC
ncbi:major facilitator superfamily domain-containing protein [Xylariales sp. PMI_506]|nr:major facilitator superfamily domain-containing protein [Xylariales sp. PMI_506]